MSINLVVAAILTLALSLLIQRMMIRLGHRFQLLDIPSSRRRHSKPIPIVGGLGVFTSWSIGLIIYSILSPEWLTEAWPSILAIGLGVVALIALGLYDDLKGLGPYFKLGTQFVVAAGILAFEPHINEIMTHWGSQLGDDYSFLIWPLGAIWIVGITNAINLIDGLDGLAGGMSALVGFSVFLLSLYKGPSPFVWIGLATLLPSLLGFLRYNWHPAKMFLGDNGSLPLGFVLACFSLSCRPVNASWVMVASILLMLGYPILDMGLAVLRRGRHGMPLFKADRSHLHYRLMRFGLTVPQTASLLLLVGLNIQIAALSFNFLSPRFALFGIGLVLVSVCTFLFLVNSIEASQEQIVREHLRDAASTDLSNVRKLVTVMKIDVGPLVNVGTVTDAIRMQKLMNSLHLLVETSTRQFEHVVRDETVLMVVFAEPIVDKTELAEIHTRFGTKIRDFLQLFNVDCALAELPIEFKTEPLLTSKAAMSVVRKDRAA